MGPDVNQIAQSGFDVAKSGMLTGVIINLMFFTALTLILYFYFRSRSRERMALIEKGVDLSKFYEKKPKSGKGLLKVGFILLGFSFGLFVAYLLNMYTAIKGVVAYFSMIMLFGGLSMVAYFFVNQRILEKKQD